MLPRLLFLRPLHPRLMRPLSTRRPHPTGTTSPPPLLSTHNILSSSSTPAPPTAIENLTPTHFHLANGQRIRGGVILLNGEVFAWNPSPTRSSADGVGSGGGRVVAFAEDAWGVLEVVLPKPGLLIIGTGANTLLLSKEAKGRILEMGIRVDAMATARAAAEYNLLAEERPGQVAAALLAEGFGK